MKTEDHRDWRHVLGAYALGDLPADERAAVAAHLEGCAECRAELRSLEGVAALLPLADPDRIEGPVAHPPADLGARVEARIAAAATGRKRERRRFRAWVAGVAAAAAVAAVLAIVALPLGGGAGSSAREIRFASVPSGVSIDATLEPRPFGTAIQMYVKGIRPGTSCRVFLRDAKGRTFSAGGFRYRRGDDSEVSLSAALDLSRTTAVGVHAGGWTFMAPVGRAPATRTG